MEAGKLHIACYSCESNACTNYDPRKWIIDSVTTSNVARPFAGVVITDHKASQIFVGDGNRLDTIRRGTMHLKNRTLSDVVVSPDMKFNLYSSAAAAKRGYNTLVTNKEALFTKDGQVVSRAPKSSDGLYIITLPVREDKVLIGSSRVAWHRRLCHPSQETLDKLIKEDAAKGIKITNSDAHRCESCALSEVSCCSHTNRSPTELANRNYILHVDTAGPMPVPSLIGSKYLVLGCLEPSGFLFAAFV